MPDVCQMAEVGSIQTDGLGIAEGNVERAAGQNGVEQRQPDDIDVSDLGLPELGVGGVERGDVKSVVDPVHVVRVVGDEEVALGALRKDGQELALPEHGDVHVLLRGILTCGDPKRGVVRRDGGGRDGGFRQRDRREKARLEGIALVCALTGCLRSGGLSVC